MNQKAYKALEYYKIINMLTDKASSSMGKEICRKLEPSTDIDEIRHMQTQTRDALTRLFQKGNISFGSVKDVRGSLKRLEIGSSLGIGELLAICSLLENTNRVKAYSRSERGDSLPDSLDGMFEALEPLTPLTTEIRRCILSEDEISDDASSDECSLLCQTTAHPVSSETFIAVPNRNPGLLLQIIQSTVHSPNR